MPSGAVAAVGTVLKRGDGASSEAFVALGEIIGIDGPTMDREQIDVTNLTSTGGYREFIAGFRDGGTVTLTMNFVYGAYDTLFGDYEDNDSHNYQIVLSDATESTLSFAAWCTACPISVQTGQQITASVTLKVTGAVTLTA